MSTRRRRQVILGVLSVVFVCGLAALACTGGAASSAFAPAEGGVVPIPEPDGASCSSHEVTVEKVQAENAGLANTCDADNDCVFLVNGDPCGCWEAARAGTIALADKFDAELHSISCNGCRDPLCDGSPPFPPTQAACVGGQCITVPEGCRSCVGPNCAPCVPSDAGDGG